ncbi:MULTISPECIES: ABC transporter permease [Streptacidiphilus]|uniref:Transport permease protein n=1 Tax=Streptacidiphilus cavernicola TaxID=3342716 RepID=A0ABV6V1X9_9ACTN|nr:ABC transporter permease [Streptacidiphilus jeojiense]
MTLAPPAQATPAPTSGPPAFTPGTRPVPPSPASAALTFAWRALLKIRRVPEQLSDVIAVPIIFTLLFTYLFGGALAGSPHRYLQFLLPGTLVMAVLLATMYTGVNLNTDLSKGVYDRFRTLPIWRPAPIVGALLGDTLRYLLASTLVIALGVALGYRPGGGVSGVLLAVALVVVFALALSWVFTLLGLVLRSSNAILSLAMVVLFPLTLASNTFVDPRTMPGWLRAVVEANPVTHLVTAARDAMAGTATLGQVGTVLLASAALVAVFAPLTMRAYRTRQ